MTAEARASSAPLQRPPPPATAAPTVTVSPEDTPHAVDTRKLITAWSTEEVGEWLEGPAVNLGQYREKLASMGVDGFMISRMKPEDLEDAVPLKADRLIIVNAAKEELATNGAPQTGARTDYGKILGHDRDD